MVPSRLYLRIVVAALGAVLIFIPRAAGAHAKLRTAKPAANAQLDTPPPEIRLTFTEPIEPALSTVTLRTPAGDRSQIIHGRRVPGDSRSCVAPLEPLKPGSYVVEWRVVSVDGHAMTGSYTFAVRGHEPAPAVAPPLPPVTPPSTRLASPMRASRREMVARWLFITGLAALLGAATASVGRFGGEAEMTLGAVGSSIAMLGVVLLADAQRRNAGTGLDELLRTSIGRALLWRAVFVGLAGGALVLARSTAARRTAMSMVTLFALASMAVHVAAGHAAAVERFAVVAIGLQWIHFAAAGVWLGGLAALLVGVRGEPNAAKTAAVQRYSTLAGLALATVAVTGVLRTVEELSSWNQLVSTDYGEAALAKASILIAIAALGALNRWHSVPAAATDLRPLRRFALLELALMIVVLGVAAILATLSPPE
jgi:copper transport protein